MSDSYPDMTKPIGSTSKDPMYDKRTTLPADEPREPGMPAAPPQVKPMDKYKG